MLELHYFVFYSQLLSLEIGDDIEIGKGAVYFAIERIVQATMLGTELIDTVLRRHGTSYCNQVRHENS